MSRQTTVALPAHGLSIIGDYKLLKKIGEGSYGEVWLAQGITGTYRAVKIVHKKNFKTDIPFQREVSGIQRFEPISREHPGFVEIFHVGPNPPEDYFYYVMELADDVSSGQEIKPDTYQPMLLAEESRLPASECIQIGLNLADALDELHRKKLCHRDIKPSNVIFVKGKPKLADIGLVGNLGPAASFVGTEGFIAPEGPGTPQADIFALGKLLYQISTGRALSDYPNLPADFEAIEDKELFVELNEVIHKACEPDITRRYKSAAELYSDLLLITRGKSIKRLRFLEGRMRLFRKVATLIILFGLIGGGFSYHFFKERQFEARSAERQAGFHSANGVFLMHNGDWLTAFKSFTAALAASPGTPEQERLQRLRLGSLLEHAPKLHKVYSGNKRISHLQFNSAGTDLLITEYSGTFWKAGVHEQTESERVRPAGLLMEMARLSPSGSWVAAGGATTAPATYNFETKQTNLWRADVPVMPYTMSLQISPDGKEAATAHMDGTVRIWSVEHGTITQIFSNHTGGVSFVTYNSDGKLMASASRDKTVKIFERETGKILFTFPHPSWVYTVIFDSPTRILTSCADWKARAWSLEDGKKILPEMPHKDVVIVMASGRRFLATSSYDGTIKLWERESLLPFRDHNIFHHESKVSAVAIHPAGNYLATGTERGVVRIWKFSDPDYVQPVESLGEPGSYVGESANSETMAFAKDDGLADKEIIVTDLFTKKPKWSFQTTTTNFQAFTLSNDGNSAGFAIGNQISVHYQNGERLQFTNNSPVKYLALSHDGSIGAIVETNNVRVWDLNAKPRRLVRTIQTNQVKGLAFWKNDTHLAIWCADGMITRSALTLWDMQTWKISKTLYHNDGILNAEMSEDFGKITTASEDFTAQIWDAKTGTRLGTALQHGLQAIDSTFNRKSTLVASAAEDEKIYLWDANSGTPLNIPIRLVSAGRSLRFSESETLYIRTRRGVFAANFPITSIPVEDLQKMADALSPILQQDLTPAQIRSDWQALRNKYPSAFE